MGAKIIFLGTAGDAITIGQQHFASGGILIKTDKTQVHIDPGPGSIVRARQWGVNLRENTCILVSQNSLAAASDVNASIAAMTHHGLDQRGVLLCNKTVYQGAEGFQPYLNKNEKAMVERAIAVEPGQRIGINDVEIKVYKAHQKDPHALGFRINIGKTSIGIPCRTVLDSSLIEDYKKLDVLILHVQMPGDLQESGALNARDAITLLKSIKPKMCLITGFGVKMMEADPLEEARRMHRESGVHVEAAKDGMQKDVSELLHSV